MNNINIEFTPAELNLLYSALNCFILEHLKNYPSARKLLLDAEGYKVILDKFDNAFEKANVEFDIF